MGTLEHFYCHNINSLLTADLANLLPSKLYEQHLIIYTRIRRDPGARAKTGT